ncbi:helix-turn-helix transcriptional regulator [Cryptosporangium aurantiacum]|uniref:helix-turn-helix transcriptional regulator n=1 Tax=Cryptosporangium aurantiacum TaxID=134849 RepID=UPI0015B92FE8|nr:helix-turn-helix transcriptional regulator [Cryptosporangium aurantiacum]
MEPGAARIRLTPLSYIILGLLDFAGESTPYELKTHATRTVNHFWVVQHAQFYAEPERLAGAGYLGARQEDGGRRRRFYALTDRGRDALASWLADPTTDFMELRDHGLLQLCFGAERGPLAEAQLAVHRAKLDEYLDLIAQGAPGPAGMRRVLEAGVAHEREWIRFWGEQA